MVAAVNKLNRAEITPKAEASSTRSNSKPDETNVRTEQNIEKDLHAKPTTLPRPYIFNKVSNDDPNLDPNIKKILDRFEINGQDKYNNAVLSKDGLTLVVATRGTVGLKQLFGGVNGFTRLMYKLFGWIPTKIFGRVNRALAVKRYKEFFNSADIEMQHEPLKHVLSALKANEYHTTAIFNKDEKTGEFTQNPDAVALTDAYQHLIEQYTEKELTDNNPNTELKAITEEIANNKERYAKYYTGDKIIPLKDYPNMSDILHQFCEGLYQAQGFDTLFIPGTAHVDPNVNSNDLNYTVLDWHSIGQDKNGKWHIAGEPKLVDEVDFKSEEDKENYKSLLFEAEYPHKITIVRPKDQAQEPIPPFISMMQGWSSMSQGSQPRTIDKEDWHLIHVADYVNNHIIQQHNKTKTAS